MTEEKRNMFDVSPTMRPIPPKMIIYGRNGIGKSSFAACAPNPIFVDLDKNTNEILCVRHDDINKFSIVTFKDLIKFLELLINEDHGFKTVVIDSISVVQRLIEKKICRDAGPNVKGIGNAGDYGQGYTRIAPMWDEFLSYLEVLWEKKRMVIILIGHNTLGEKDNPLGEDHLEYKLSVDKRGILPLQSWCTCMLFFVDKPYFEEVKDSKDSDEPKKVSFSKRVIYTDSGTIFTAKNTIKLPEIIDFESPQKAWDLFHNHALNFYKKGNK